MTALVVVLAWVMIVAGGFLGFRRGVSEREFGFGIFFVVLGFSVLLGLIIGAAAARL